MKTKQQLLTAILFLNFSLITVFCFPQGAAINTSGATAHPSSMLDISADNAGILIPRMTKSQKILIPSPAIGLMIYQTDDTTGFWYFNGNAWIQSIGVTGATGSTGAVGATGITGAVGATGFLTSGSAAGNTPYWDGNQWNVNSSNIFNNGGSVGIGTNNPDSSAAIDITSTAKGALIPRMTTNERNSIASPAEGLEIFNTDSKCFEYFAYGFWQTGNCATCFIPTDAGTITGSSSVCQGDNSVSYSVPSINYANNYIWSYSGSGFTINGNSNTITIDFSISATSGNLTVKGNNQCGDGNPSADYAITINSIPASPLASTHIETKTEITWNWNTVSGATGYKYSTANDYSTATDNFASTSFPQTGLTCGTSYSLYVWAYNNCGNSAVTTLTQNTSACGWICGDPFTDARDNNVYNTVLIGTQCWMAQNLAFLDVVTASGVYSKTIPYKHVYGYNGTDVAAAKATANYATYGVIYNWPSMLNGSSPCNGSGTPPNDKCTNPIQGVCPTGWHVPSHYEITTMERNVGSNPGDFPYDNNTSNVFLGTDEGGNLKETGTTHWASPNTGATNSSGFNLLPGGCIWMGTFYDIGTGLTWFSSSERDASAAWYRKLDNTHATIYRAGYSDSKWVGGYVRCVKD